MHLHQCKSENIYTILYSVAYFIHTYRSGAVWNLQIPKKTEYFKNLVVCTTDMNMHNFINMFATIFIPMWAGGWTRRYSEGSSKLTQAMTLYEYSLSLEFSLFTTTIPHPDMHKTRWQPFVKKLIAHICLPYIFIPFLVKKNYSGWSWPHMTICLQMARHMSFLFFFQTLSIVHQSFISLSIPNTLSSLIKCYFLNSPQIPHYFLSDHKFCSKLLGFHEPWVHFFSYSYYLNYFLPIWLYEFLWTEEFLPIFMTSLYLHEVSCKYGQLLRCFSDSFVFHTLCFEKQFLFTLFIIIHVRYDLFCL